MATLVTAPKAMTVKLQRRPLLARLWNSTAPGGAAGWAFGRRCVPRSRWRSPRLKYTMGPHGRERYVPKMGGRRNWP